MQQIVKTANTFTSACDALFHNQCAGTACSQSRTRLLFTGCTLRNNTMHRLKNKKENLSHTFTRAITVNKQKCCRKLTSRCAALHSFYNLKPESVWISPRAWKRDEGLHSALIDVTNLTPPREKVLNWQSDPPFLDAGLKALRASGQTLCHVRLQNMFARLSATGACVPVCQQQLFSRSDRATELCRCRVLTLKGAGRISSLARPLQANDLRGWGSPRSVFTVGLILSADVSAVDLWISWCSQ